MTNLRNSIKNIIREFVGEKTTSYKITEIKYFSPDGRKTIPNGHPYQKGFFIKECKDNLTKFKTENYQYLIGENLEIVEAVHDQQYGLYDYRGGIITFSTEINSLEISDVKIINWFKKKYKSIVNKFFSKSKLNSVINRFNSIEDKKLGKDNIDDYIGAFSIGNFFSGRYIGDNGKVFDESSLSIEINGISSKGLIYLAEEIAREFQQETVLVKDLNSNKIFLVNQIKGDDYSLDNINKKSV
jgi:hypothetical protein